MTIAACYVSLEGVVLGADSTSTYQCDGQPDHYYNHEQKILEIGEGSTLGLVTWGLGHGLSGVSYRTLAARLADEMVTKPPASVGDVAQRWANSFWTLYDPATSALRKRFTDLMRISPKSEAEDKEFKSLHNLVVGFCIGGHLTTDRTPQAFEISFAPWANGPIVNNLPIGSYCWGVPNLLFRLIKGMDNETHQSICANILKSGKWGGTPEELASLIKAEWLQVPKTLPLREAVDWIYSSIFLTIKAIKFSQIPQVCGGPVEVAAIATDRRFRWVSHKGLDEAISHRPYHQRPVARSLQ